MVNREALIALLRDRSVSHGEYQLASGKRSSYYIDARPTTMSAEGLVLIGQLGLQAIRAARWTPTAVGGLTLGADPVAYAIASASAGSPPLIDAFSVRKDRKTHGAERQVEGNFSPGTPVVVVEDVITTGGSALRAVQILRDVGADLLGVLAVVDREEGGRETIEAQGLKVVALTTTSDLMTPRA